MTNLIRGPWPDPKPIQVSFGVDLEIKHVKLGDKEFIVFFLWGELLESIEIEPGTAPYIRKRAKVISLKDRISALE